MVGRKSEKKNSWDGLNHEKKDIYIYIHMYIYIYIDNTCSPCNYPNQLKDFVYCSTLFGSGFVTAL